MPPEGDHVLEHVKEESWQPVMVNSCDLATVALPSAVSAQIHRMQEVAMIDDADISRTSKELAVLFGALPD